MDIKVLMVKIRQTIYGYWINMIRGNSEFIEPLMFRTLYIHNSRLFTVFGIFCFQKYPHRHPSAFPKEHLWF